MQLAFNGAAVLTLALKSGLNAASGPGAFLREADLNLNMLTTCFIWAKFEPSRVKKYVEC